MILNSILPITQALKKCPKCESAIKTPEGEKIGVAKIDYPIVYRSCKCGFELKYDLRNGTARGKIKKAIDASLENMK